MVISDGLNEFLDSVCEHDATVAAQGASTVNMEPSAVVRDRQMPREALSGTFQNKGGEGLLRADTIVEKWMAGAIAADVEARLIYPVPGMNQATCRIRTIPGGASWLGY